MTEQQLHDLYVWKLRKELLHNYEAVSTNVEIHNRSRVVAEIDVLAKKDGELHVFEVKNSRRLTKARKQCRQIRRYYAHDIAKFFLYCAEADTLIELTP